MDKIPKPISILYTLLIRLYCEDVLAKFSK